jgi:hypothetical protein
MKTMLFLASFLLLFGLAAVSDQAQAQHPAGVPDQAVLSSATTESYDCAREDTPEVYISKKEQRAQCKNRCRKMLMDKGYQPEQDTFLRHLKDCVSRCMQGAEA